MGKSKARGGLGERKGKEGKWGEREKERERELELIRL